ncbi:MAG: LamG domain-containing protein, partial [Candidatus Thorarchaeota archaeon]
MPNRLYRFRHKASIDVGSRVVWDVNAVFDLPFGSFIFSIPEPEWVSTATADFNTGVGFDFNYTKVTQDANVMPSGELDFNTHKSYPANYDVNLVAYYKFDDTFYEFGDPDCSGTTLSTSGNWMDFYDGATICDCIQSPPQEVKFTSGISEGKIFAIVGDSGCDSSGCWNGPGFPCMELSSGFDDGAADGDTFNIYPLGEGTEWVYNDVNNSDANGEFKNGADNNAWGLWDTNALFLDGVDDFVSLSEGLLEGNDEMTVCAWVYPKAQKFNGIISDQYNTSDDNFVRLVIRDSMKVDWGCKVDGDDSGLIQGGSLSVGLNRWSYVCGTYTGSETLIYVNGVRDSTTASGCSPFTNAVLPRIGTYWDGSSTFSFNGYIDEFRIYNRALSLGEIQADYNAWANAYYYSEVKDLNHWGKAKKLNWKAKFGSVQLRDLDRDANLVAHYKFNDNNSDGIQVRDETGNNNGQLINGADLNVVSFFDDNALFLDGVDDHVDIADDDVFSFTDGNGNDLPFSISAWVYPTFTTQGEIVSKYNTSGNHREWVFSIMSNQSLRTALVKYNDYGTRIGVRTATGTIILNKWQHVAMTYDGSESSSGLKLFINGVEFSTTTDNSGSYAGMTNRDAPVSIGVSSISSYPFGGYIEELKIYDRAITLEEVQTLYTQGLNDLNVAVRTCSDSTCATASQWMEFDYGNDMNGVLGNNVDLPAGRYVQYRAGFQHADSNYPIGYAYLSDVNLVYNRLPDVNVWRVDGFDVSQPLPFFSYVTDGNFTIDFNVADWDSFDGLRADINYSTSSLQGTGTSIVEGLVVDGNFCETNFFDASDVNFLHYYKFDGVDGNTSRILDYQGGLHGKYVDTTKADSNAQGKFDTNAAWFSGDTSVSANDGGTAIMEGELAFGAGPYTVMGWFKNEQVSGFGIVFSNQPPAGGWKGFLFRISSLGKIGLYNTDSGVVSINTGDGFAVVGEWHHIAWWRDDVNATHSQYKIYVDGKVVPDTNQGRVRKNISNGQMFRIAYDDDRSDWWRWKGEMDEVKVFNRALSDDEIAEDYRRGVINLRECSWD